MQTAVKNKMQSVNVLVLETFRLALTLMAYQYVWVLVLGSQNVLIQGLPIDC